MFREYSTLMDTNQEGLVLDCFQGAMLRRIWSGDRTGQRGTCLESQLCQVKIGPHDSAGTLLDSLESMGLIRRTSYTQPSGHVVRRSVLTDAGWEKVAELRGKKGAPRDSRRSVMPTYEELVAENRMLKDLLASIRPT